MQPSPVSKVVAATTLELDDRATEEPALISPESLLRTLGYKIDQRGILSFIADKNDDDESRLKPAFAGSFDLWKERYDGVTNSLKGRREQFQAHALFEIRRSKIVDRWNDDRQMELRLITPFGLDVPMTARASEEVLRRLRVLQTLEHPGLLRLTDFFISDDWRLYLVSCPMSGAELRPLASGSKPGDELSELLTARGETTALTWLVQLVNSLIAAQSLTPPLVPRSLSGVRLFLSSFNGSRGAPRVVLADYDLSYVVAPYSATHFTNSNKKEMESGGMIQVLKDIGSLFLPYLEQLESDWELDKELCQLLDSLSDPPSDLNSVYKLRSALKSLEGS